MDSHRYTQMTERLSKEIRRTSENLNDIKVGSIGIHSQEEETQNSLYQSYNSKILKMQNGHRSEINKIIIIKNNQDEDSAGACSETEKIYTNE